MSIKKSPEPTATALEFSVEILRRLLQPHRNVLLLQKLFHVAHGVGAEMKNARGENGVGFPLHIP
jgi:hypothetical protein